MSDIVRDPFFVSRAGKRYGPFPADRLKEYAGRKRLLPSDLVCRQGSADWIQADSLPWLFPAGPAQTPKPRDDDSSDNILEFDAQKGSGEGPLSVKGISARPAATLTFGDFQVLKKLGAGGMGAVYLAMQRSSNRRVAMKLLSKHLAERPDYVRRFYREAFVLSTLDHPNIVRFYGVGEEAGVPFFAMEYIDGMNSGQVLKHFGRFEVGDALHIVLRCADGLGYGHGRDIIHRDVTPGNILISREGVVKLVDLGLAKPANGELSEDTESGVTMGTPRYAAPEQTLNSKNADCRSDIYSLGIVLYHFLTGKLPFEGNSIGELQKAKETGKFTAARRLNDNVPSRLDLIIDKMLAREPRYRYQTCALAVRDIEALSLHHARLSFNLVDLGSKPIPHMATQLEILLIYDNTEDIQLTQEALRKKRIRSNLYIFKDDLQALNFLRKEGRYASASSPHAIIISGALQAASTLAVVEEIKTSQALRGIPVVALSDAPAAARAYLDAHGLSDKLVVSKVDHPQEFSDFLEAVRDLCLTELA